MPTSRGGCINPRMHGCACTVLATQAVDELVRKRAAEGPFTLPPPFDLAPPGDDEEPPGDGQQRRQPQGLTPADLRGKQPPNPLPNALTRTQVSLPCLAHNSGGWS